MRARYDIIESTKDYVAISDTGDHTMHTTVTNDAEAVVDDLAHRLMENGVPLPKHIIYLDTDGTWDELLHEGGKFVGFRTLNARRLDSAIQALGLKVPERWRGVVP
jgi:hypothetical protein